MTSLSRSGPLPIPRAPRGGRGAPIALGATVLAGCLFVNDINRHPVAVLTADRAGDPVLLDRCQQVKFDATGSSDPSDPGQPLKHEWRVDEKIPSMLGKDIVFRAPDEGAHATADFYAAGDHVVAVRVTDRQGARSKEEARIAVRVTDRPPTARIKLISTPSGCDDFAGGAAIDLLGFADPGDSAPMDSLCVEEHSYRFVLRAPADSRSAVLVDGPCATAADKPGQRELTVKPTGKLDQARVCLRTDVRGAYEIQLVADDGVGRPPAEVSANGQTTALPVTVVDDRPACLVGFDPAPGLLYLLDRDQRQRFEVFQVLDDVDPFPATSGIAFRWAVWQESDPTWRPLPAWREPSLVLDPTRFAVDELVRVRVEAVDHSGRSPTCDPKALVCEYTKAYGVAKHCFGNAPCLAQVTWEARFR